MKYYKLNNEVYAFDESQGHLITPNMIAMTESEVEAHINPLPTPEQLDDAAFSEWKEQQVLDKETELRLAYEASK